MASFVLTLISALVVAAAGFAIAAFTLGRVEGLNEAIPDGRYEQLPTDRALTSTDVGSVKFDMALRGYRMAQVDAVMTRVGRELAGANARVAELELELHTLRYEAKRPDPPMRDDADDPQSAGEEQ